MYSYKVKIIKRGFVWGGEGVLFNLRSPLLLNVRTNDEGERIAIALIRAGVSEPVPLGTLEADQTLTIPLTDLSGVLVTTEFDVIVDCYLMAPGAGDLPSQIVFPPNS